MKEEGFFIYLEELSVGISSCGLACCCPMFLSRLKVIFAQDILKQKGYDVTFAGLFSLFFASKIALVFEAIRSMSENKEPSSTSEPKSKKFEGGYGAQHGSSFQSFCKRYHPYAQATQQLLSLENARVATNKIGRMPGISSENKTLSRKLHPSPKAPIHKEGNANGQFATHPTSLSPPPPSPPPFFPGRCCLDSNKQHPFWLN